MGLSLLYLYLPACIAVSATPGPSNVLSLSHGSRHGFGPACLAGSGRLAAFIAMMALVSAGLAAALHAAPVLFEAIQIAGIGYLLFLLVRCWRQRRARGLGSVAPDCGLLRMARNEFVLAAGNPKVVVVFTVLVPRLVDPAHATVPQLALMGALFLSVEWLVIAAYAGVGAHLARCLKRPAVRRRLGRFLPRN